jgi:hypothetical protein
MFDRTGFDLDLDPFASREQEGLLFAKGEQTLSFSGC